MDSISYKTCHKCRKTKPIHEFNKLTKSKDGYQAKCRQCEKDYRTANQERIKIRVKRYCDAHVEQARIRTKNWAAQNKDKIREYRASNKEKIARDLREWKRDNAEYVKEYQRRYRSENKEAIRTQEKAHRTKRREHYRHVAREYKQRNRAKIIEQKRVSAQRRNARKVSLPDTLTNEQWAYCLEYWNYRCVICERPFDDLFGERTVAADHWIPLSSPDCPGTVANNILCLCHGIGGCNNEKHSFNPIEWLEKKLGKRKAKKKLKEIREYFEIINELA